MAIYQRGNNWYIDFTFKGRRVRESIGPSKKNAQKVIDKKKTESLENKYLDIKKDPDPIKFHEFAKEYLEWCRENHKAASRPNELSKMRILDETFGGKNIHEITGWEIEKWKLKRKKEVEPSTVNRELAQLKNMFSKAIEWKKLTEHPAKGVKLFKGATKRLRYRMPDEVQRLIGNCPDYLKPIVGIAINTGMRRGEILGLEWNRVDMDRGAITLTDTKNSEPRIVPMNETAKAIFNGLERKEGLIFPVGVNLMKKDYGEALEKSKISLSMISGTPSQATL